MGLPNPSRETKFSGANADRGTFIPIQLTTYRIGNLTRFDPYSCYMCVWPYIERAQNSARYSPEHFARGAFWLLSIPFVGHKRSGITQDEHNQAPLDNNTVDVCA